jgi:hypothetical protein
MTSRGSALVLCIFLLAAVTHEADATLDQYKSEFSDVDGSSLDSRARGSLQFAKSDSKHNCGDYGKANNCKAKWFRSTKECRCMG